MAVRKTANGLWVADVTLGKRLDGSRDRRTETHPTKAKAEKAERRLLLQKEQNHGKSFGGILFADFVDDFFWPQKTKLRGNTVKGYKRDLKLRLLPAFSDKAVEDIDRYAIQRMISSCATRKVATNARETLSSILSLALEMGVIPINPAGFSYEYPDATRVDPEAMGVWLTSFAEIERVVLWVARTMPNTPEERMVVLGLLHGMRKGEVLGLDGPHIDLARRGVTIEQSYTEGEHGPELTGPKTPKAYRTIPSPTLACEIMSAWDLDDGPVVRGRDGGRMNPSTARDRIARVFRDAAFEDGEPVPRLTQFSMRHSYGTASINAGMEVTKLSRIMGHVDVHTTQTRYVKQRFDDLRDEMDVIDSAMRK